MQGLAAAQGLEPEFAAAHGLPFPAPADGAGLAMAGGLALAWLKWSAAMAPLAARKTAP
ncbi:hypothetical protein [Thalassospira mesophila]|nr:hypothetical protein [Thalassospira mesophila]